MAGEIALALLITAQDKASGILKNLTQNMSPLQAGMVGVGIAAIAAGVESVKMAANFQSSTTTLITSAGESAKNIDMVRQGILQMAVDTGTSTDQLVQGMYMIESAGFHGAAGLQVLKAAAQGARAENASLATVGNAVTTMLTDYHMSAGQAVNAVNALVATTSAGKTHMEDLAASMGAVLPIASALGLSFPQVAGALATMTDAGMSAQHASQNLAFAIRALAAPNKVAMTSMKDVGLSAQQVKDTMAGPGGLAAAIELITEHVGKKFPAGSVEAVQAFKKIMGGAVGYNVALMLGGKNMKDYEARVKLISAALNGGSKEVMGWSDIQNTMNFRLSQFQEALNVLMIVLGTMFLPLVGKVFEAMTFVVQAFINLVSAGGPVVTFLQSTSFAADLVRTALLGLGIGIALFLATYLPGLIAGFWAYAVAAWNAAAAVIAATWPFILIGLAIAGVILLFRKLYDNWTAFRVIVNLLITDLKIFWNVLVNVVGAGLQFVWKWIQNNIIPALQLFYQWVTGNIMAALKLLDNWIMSNVVPALRKLWDWLEIQLVHAFRVVTDWINANIIPALRLFWNWIQTSVIPALQKWYDWLQNQIVTALSNLATWLKGAVSAALGIFWDWIQNKVIPVLQTWWTWLEQKIGQALSDLAGWIQNQVIPQLQALWTWVENKVVTALQDWYQMLTTKTAQALAGLSNQIQTVVIPQLQSFWQWLENKIIPALQTWNQQMQTTTNQGMKVMTDDTKTKAIPALQVLWDWIENKQVTALASWMDSLKTSGKSIADWSQKTSDGQGAMILLHDAVKSVTDYFNATMQPALAALKTTFDTQLVPAIYDFKYAFDQLNTTMQVIANMLQSVFNPQLANTDKAIKPVQTDTQLLSQILQATFLAALTLVTGALGGIIQGFANFLFGLNQVIAGIAEAFRGMRESIQGTMSLIADIIQGKWDNIYNDFDMMGRGIYDITMGTWQSILGVFNMSMSTITGFVDGFVKIIEQYFQNLSNDLVGHSIIPDMWTAIKQSFATSIANLIAQVQQGVANITTQFTNLSSRIMNVLNGVAGQMFGVGNNMMQSLGQGIMSGAGAVGNAIHGVISGILGPMGISIPGFATGVTNFKGGLAMVGENGPELMYLPYGSSIYTQSQMKSMFATPQGGNPFALSQGSASSFALNGNTRPIIIQVQPQAASIMLDGKKVGQSTMSYQRKEISIQGGYRLS